MAWSGDIFYGKSDINNGEKFTNSTRGEFNAANLNAIVENIFYLKDKLDADAFKKLGAGEITPSSFPQTLNAVDRDLDGFTSVTIKAPTNLTAENIAEGVTIAGITGTFKGSNQGATDSSTIYYGGDSDGSISNSLISNYSSQKITTIATTITISLSKTGYIYIYSPSSKIISITLDGLDATIDIPAIGKMNIDNTLYDVRRSGKLSSGEYNLSIKFL